MTKLKLRRTKFVPPSRRVENVNTGPVKKPHYFGAAKPEILFVIDPIVANAEADEPPKPSKPIPNRQLEFLTAFCKKHGIPLGKAAITWCCPPVLSETWDSDKRMNDARKIYRDRFVEIVREANPKLIVAMGKSGGSQAFGKSIKITKVRGSPVYSEEFDCLIFPSLGLGHVIRIPENERTFDADFATLKKIVDSGYKLTYQSKIETDYTWSTDISDLIARADGGEKLSLSVDAETLGLRYYDPASRILTVQISDKPGRAVAVPVDYNHNRHRFPVRRELRAKIVRQLKKLLEHKNVEVFGQNFKFDFLMLKHKLGIEVRNFVDDTICLMHGVDENMLDKSLDEITRQYVPAMAGYADEFNRDPIHQKKTRMDLVPPDKMLMYGCGDVDACYRAKIALEAELLKDLKAYKCYRTVVMPALRAFCKIEGHGFPISRKKLKAFEVSLRRQQDADYRTIRRMVPKEIEDAELKPRDEYDKETGKLIKRASLTRPGFLISMLFKHPKGLRITPKVFTKSTAKLKDRSARVPSTSGKMHLAYFEDDYEFVKRIMEYIKNEKLLGTYVGTDDVDDGESVTGFYKYIFEGRIRPSYLLHRVVTGRTSSQDPNGQNTPKRGKMAKKYREVFVAPPGYVLLSVDFSQMELRIAAVMANDPTMLRLYREGKDIHTATACVVMGITEEEFYRLPKEDQAFRRFQAKAVNFGFLYGMGWRKFMTYARTDYGVTFTEEEAQNIRKRFFQRYYNLEKWHMAVREYVRENGYVRALDGRVRHLTSVFSPDEMIASSAERQAINSPVQCLGSDLGLIAIANIVDEVDPNLARVIGFIHDAIICLVPEDRVTEAAATIKHYMENVPFEKMFGMKLNVPIVAEAEVGKDLSNVIELSDSDLSDVNVITWSDIKNKEIAKWETKCNEARAAGKELPKHPFPGDLKSGKLRLVPKRKITKLKLTKSASKPVARRNLKLKLRSK